MQEANLLFPQPHQSLDLARFKSRTKYSSSVTLNFTYLIFCTAHGNLRNHPKKVHAPKIKMVIFVNWKTVATAFVALLLLVGVYVYSLGAEHCYDSSNHQNSEYYNHLKQKIAQQQAANDLKCRDMLQRMRAEIAETKQRNEDQRNCIQELKRKNRYLNEKVGNGMQQRVTADDQLDPLIKPALLRSLNIHQQTEFDVVPYTSFTKYYIYQLEPEKPKFTPAGDQAEEIEDVLQQSLTVLNTNSKGARKYHQWDLLQGYSRTDRMVGTQYNLFYRTKGRKKSFEYVSMFRPFAPLQNVQVQNYDKSNEWINLIVPLAGRVEMFVNFMDMFVEQCIKKDKRVFLTVVYFGEDGKEEVKEILERVTAENHFTHYKFIERLDDFSRGVGLSAGAESWDGDDVLLFFCDVDMHFKDGFLDRCRLNTAPGSKVYYPIVFSLYNPSIVYSDRTEKPAYNDMLIINKDSGFWRTFGFGMACMYRSDYMFMHGFDTSIHGWGYEDVKLYQQFVKSNTEVIRSPDQGIFHNWHEKQCDPQLEPTQYSMCLSSKAVCEASHKQLGMLLFGQPKKVKDKLCTKRIDESDRLDPVLKKENNGVNSEIKTDLNRMHSGVDPEDSVKVPDDVEEYIGDEGEENGDYTSSSTD